MSLILLLSPWSQPTTIANNGESLTTAKKPMPYVAPKAKRTWEELLADLDTALSGDECDIDVIQAMLKRCEPCCAEVGCGTG